LSLDRTNLNSDEDGEGRVISYTPSPLAPERNRRKVVGDVPGGSERLGHGEELGIKTG